MKRRKASPYDSLIDPARVHKIATELQGVLNDAFNTPRGIGTLSRNELLKLSHSAALFSYRIDQLLGVPNRVNSPKPNKAAILGKRGKALQNPAVLGGQGQTKKIGSWSSGKHGR